MTDHYAVMGNPVAHSMSPAIHAEFARQTGEDLHYSTILVPRDGFTAAVRDFQAGGGRGLNITVPFKHEAWELAGQHSQRAQQAGAVNTLSFLADGRIVGDNTDGFGLVRDITHNQRRAIRNQRVLLLGAGGAVRGVLGPILDAQPAGLVIANRTASRARDLAAAHAADGPVSGCGLDELGDMQFDLVINGTAASLQGEVPALPDTILAPDAWCYDMMYSAGPTVFVQWGHDHGAARSLDGLGMLVEQAAESFYIWRGVRPQTAPVLKMLRSTIHRTGA